MIPLLKPQVKFFNIFDIDHNAQPTFNKYLDEDYEWLTDERLVRDKRKTMIQSEHYNPQRQRSTSLVLEGVCLLNSRVWFH